MSANSNWPGGIDYGHSNFTLRFPRVSRFDGQGGFAPNSTHIPPLEAAMYILGTAFAVWFAWEVLKFLVGA